MYRVRGADQTEYGPANADLIRQWIAHGRITSQTQLQQEGSSEWKPITDFPEFRDALAARQPPPLSGSVSPGGQKQQGLAVTSLVFGILSFFCLGPLGAIPAIITGHVALSRSRKSPQMYGGGAMALTGLIMGYVAIALTVLVLPALMLPALAKAKARAETIRCMTNMRQIGIGARIWANENGGKFPPNFITMSNELQRPNILVCPSDGTNVAAQSWVDFGPQNVSYLYLKPGITEGDIAVEPVFQCPIHGHICYADGSVTRGDQSGGGGRRRRQTR